MGRPTKHTPETELAILNALRVGNTRTDSALAAGISYELLRQWCGSLEFLAAVQRAEAEARLRMVGIIAKAAVNTWQAAAWFLERREPEHWGRRDRLDVHTQLEKEVRRLSEEADVNYEDALAEAERILEAGR